jgi:hypothetical protein
VNNRDKNFTRNKIDRRRAQLEESVLRYLRQLETADRQEPTEALATKSAHLKEKLAKLKEEMGKLEAHERRMLASPDAQISLTDPDSRSMATSGRGSGVVGYNVQVAVDTTHHLIVTHEVTNSGSDRSQLAGMANKAKELGRFRDSDVLRHIFERIVRTAMATGLVKGEGFAVDASVLEANASRYHGKPPDELDWSDRQRQRRAVAEYLAALDETVEPNPDRKVPKVISPSDPASAWTAKANKRVQFGYGLNYLIDIENAVIVDVEATPARTYDEVAATRTMIERIEACFALKPKRLAADTAYGTGAFLGCW